MSAEARLKELGLVLPTLPKPVANYLPYRLAGTLLFLAGQGPRRVLNEILAYSCMAAFVTGIVVLAAATFIS
jgi:hypothetical protein